MGESADPRCGLSDYRIFKQFYTSLGLNLGSNDNGSLAVALFNDVDQGGGLFVGVVSYAQVIENQNLDVNETSNVVR
jgi:hypothetical protein